MQFSKMLLLSLLTPAVCVAERIQSSHLNLANVEKIAVGPGLISVVEFPEDVLEARVGAPHIFKVIVSPANPRELLLHVVNPQPFATNMVVRTVRRTFVFDLLPSTSKHQDFFQVKGGYGSPSLRNSTLVESAKLQSSERRSVVGKVIERGEIQ